jgi:hypothetical protein
MPSSNARKLGAIPGQAKRPATVIETSGGAGEALATSGRIQLRTDHQGDREQEHGGRDDVRLRRDATRGRRVDLLGEGGCGTGVEFGVDYVDD